MQQTSFQGNTMGWLDDGEGMPVVLLHGFCETAKMWDDFTTHLPGYRFIRPNLPGATPSALPDMPLTIEYMADAVATVLDACKVHNAAVIGHSMGGYVALAFAEKYPNRLLGLGLFHSHPFADSPEKREVRNKHIAFVLHNGPIMYAKQLFPSLFAPELRADHRMTLEKLKHEVVQAYTAKGIIAQLEAMRERPDRSEILKRLCKPVWMLIGEKDPAISLELSMQMTHLPENADIHLLPQVGHMGMFTATRQTARLLRSWLRALQSMKDS